MISSRTKVACLLMLLSFATMTAAAQTTRPYELEPGGDAAGALLHGIQYLTKEIDKPVILIARLGDGETARKWNVRRLHNVTERLYNVKQVIKTEGERIAGKGRVELYFEGKLLYVLLAHRNKDLATDCCEGFRDLYPWYNPIKDRKELLVQRSEEELPIAPPKVAYAAPDNSEFTGALMALLNNKVKQSPNKLILVSRLGDGERSGLLHLRRLRAVESALFVETQEKWVLTQGEKVKGLGRVECYVDGARELTLMTEQNEGFVMSCCNLAANDPRWFRVRRKRELRLAKEKALVRKHHKNNR